MLLTSCVKISGSLKSLTPKNDFLKTEFVPGPSQPADGVSGMVLAIQLKNSDNSSVPSYQPNLGVAAGSNVIITGCSTSDSNGISACIVKTIDPGQKTLVLTNAKVGLKQVVTFTAPQGARLGGTISGSLTGVTTNGGSKLNLSLGAAVSGPLKVTQGGYKIRMTARTPQAAQ